MRILIATDSFKGSLSTLEAAGRIKAGAEKVFPQAEFCVLPLADGGEGTAETLTESLGGIYRYAAVHGPDGRPVRALYGLLDPMTAVLEMAQASGLTLVPETRRNIMTASTYGTGELIRAALDLGCRKICIGIGGSATNDGGVGMAQALGVSFIGEDGREVGPGGGALEQIREIRMEGLDPRLKETELTVMCDVTNPLYGPQGAARVYGKQKGASEKDMELLDRGMEHLADLVCAELGTDYRWEQGAGAAGGLGFGLLAFAGARLRRGIETILDLCGFDEKAKWADLIVTGEGRIDGQSVCGKVIDGIAGRAARYQKPVIAIGGSIGEDGHLVYEAGVDGMEACVCRPMDTAQAMEHAGEYLEQASLRIFRSIRLGMELGKV